MQLKFGTDPEFMVFDPNGKLTSAINILPNNGKTKKMLVGGEGLGGFIFYDNVQLEVNINPSVHSGQLTGNLRTLFHEIKKKIYPYTFAPRASAIFPEDQLTHPDAKVFGCDPEFDAYSLEIVQAPTSENGFRSAGGHIHLGQDEGATPLNIPTGEDNDNSDRDWGRISVIRMMDLIVGLPGIILDTDETSKARRKLYGSPGYHRTKEYGVEYRSMGNFWLGDPIYVSLIFNLSYQAVVSVIEGQYRDLWPTNDIDSCKYPVDKVCRAIKESDVGMAKELVEKYVKPIISKNLYIDFLTACDKKPANTSSKFYRNWEI